MCRNKQAGLASREARLLMYEIGGDNIDFQNSSREIKKNLKSTDQSSHIFQDFWNHA